jgi:hypothetical protein
MEATSVKKVFHIEPDWYVAESKQELENLWLDHHGGTHEEMTGEPMPLDEVEECNPGNTMTIDFEYPENIPDGFFLVDDFTINHAKVKATYASWANFSPKGFLASTEY